MGQALPRRDSRPTGTGCEKQQNHFKIVEPFIRIPPVESLKVERLSGNWGPACGDSERREENSGKISFSVSSEPLW